MLGKFLTVLRVCSQQKGVTSTGIALIVEVHQDVDVTSCGAAGRSAMLGVRRGRRW